MIKQFLVRTSRAILRLVRTFSGAIEAGVVPHQASPTAVHENIAWGQRWIAAAVVSGLSGEAVHVSRVDAVMLVLFLASIVVTRRWKRPVIVYQASQTT